MVLIFDLTITEKRAKKMEEMAAKRNKGEDDGTSVSGLSKLRRRRKKKVQDEADTSADVMDSAKEETPVVVTEETEEEKQRRLRAGKACYIHCLSLGKMIQSLILCLFLIMPSLQRNEQKRWKRWLLNVIQEKTMTLLYLAFQNITE